MISTLSRLAWGGLVLLVLVLLAVQYRGGFRIDTSFSAMVPVSREERDTMQALAAARDQADQGIILLFTSDNQTQLDQALAAIIDAFKAHPELLKLSVGGTLPEPVQKLLVSHRFQLLSPQQRQQLESGQLDELLQDTISNLYGAAAEMRLAGFEDDPFNTLGTFVEEQISGNFPQPEPDQRVIKLRLLPGSAEHRAQQTLDTLFTGIGTLLASEYPDVRMARSGVFFFAKHAAADAKRDINLISTGSMLGLVVLLLMVFRSIWPLIIPVVSILTGVLSAFVLVHTLYGSVHVFTIVFGASLIGIVIDYSIHYFFHAAHNRSSDRDTHSLLRALLVSLFTSVVGYAALALAGVELLEKIAVFSVCGVVASWLTVVSWAPLVDHRIRIVDPQPLRLVYRCVHWLASLVNVMTLSAAHPLFRIIVLLPALVALALYIAFFARGQDDPRKFVDMPAALLEESQSVANAFQGIEPGKFLLARGADEQALFDLLEQFYRRIEAGPARNIDNIGVVSMLDWLPSARQQRENHALSAPLYQSDGLASQLFDTLGMDSEPVATLESGYTGSQGRTLQAEALFASAPGELPSLISKSASGYFAYVFITQGADTARLRSAAQQLAGVEFVDSVQQSMNELKLQRQASVVMLGLAYAVVGMLLLLLYRRARSLLMLLLPASATLITVLVLVLFNVPITLFHTMALFLILGLGMDYSVFLTELTADRRATLQAILLSALTSMLSFGLLSLSSVPVAQAFGLTVFVGNSLNLLMAFTLAPVLMVASNGLENRS